jgi:hypothetical protein
MLSLERLDKNMVSYFGCRASRILGLCLAMTMMPRPATPQDALRTEEAPLQAFAGVSGAVRDPQGAALAGLWVTVAGQDNALRRLIKTDSNGAFTFDELLPGAYQVTIDSLGIEPFTSAPVILSAGERGDLPIVVVRIPTKVTTIDVTATLREVAQEQVKQEEEQRILGILPNYFVSYVWDAAPITPKLKFGLTLRSTLDPVTFLVAAGLAGAEQRHNTFPGYGQGADGYAKRFGAAYADIMVTKMVSRAILPIVLHQDPRYFYQGSGTIRSRIAYALASAVMCRADDGRMQANYSQVVGNFAASGISNLYRAPGDRNAGLTLRNGLIMTGTGAVENLLREFLSRNLTPNVPKSANGKP